MNVRFVLLAALCARVMASQPAKGSQQRRSSSTAARVIASRPARASQRRGSSRTTGRRLSGSDAARITLHINEELPHDHPALTPTLTPANEAVLQKLYNETLDRMQSLHIDASLAFGTILGQARHGKRMPWDDDLDFMMHERHQHAFVAGLPLYNATRHTPWCRDVAKCKFHPQHTTNQNALASDAKLSPASHCCSWMLGEDILVTWKPSGMPWKITPVNAEWPCIDMNSFFVSENRTFMPDYELQNGHVHHFEMPTEAMLPLRPVQFFGRQTFVPRDVDVVLSTLWGPRWAVDCAVTYNHHGSSRFYTKGNFPGIENTQANKFVKLIFPCKFMPEAYHGEFMDGRGLERFGHSNQTGAINPPSPLLAQAFANYEIHHASEMIVAQRQLEYATAEILLVYFALACLISVIVKKTWERCCTGYAALAPEEEQI